MADQGKHEERGGPRFESPIVSRYPAVTAGLLTLTDWSSLTKTLIRAGVATPAAAKLGVAYGASRFESVVGGSVLVSGQRPTEWLVIGRAELVRSVVDGLDPSGHVSVVDHTHGRAMFRLTGPLAPSVLEKVCDIDWSDPMTPDGAVVSGSVAGVGCDIIRTDRADRLDKIDASAGHGGLADDSESAADPGPIRSYLLTCDRSFAQYLFDRILDAGAEFGIEAAVG